MGYKMGAFQIGATITNRHPFFQRLTGLGVIFSLRHPIVFEFEMHPIKLSYMCTTI